MLRKNKPFLCCFKERIMDRIKKKVTFNLTNTYYEVDGNIDRRGTWREDAERDEMRFKNKLEKVRIVLEPMLVKRIVILQNDLT
jgi:hypothetical protein